MVTALLRYGEEALGEWEFDALPRVGEVVSVRDMEAVFYRVTEVEHQPLKVGYDPAEYVMPWKQRVVLRLKLIGYS